MTHEILIVDDEADIRSLISGILSDEGYKTREAESSTSALEAVRSRRPALIVLDVWLQGSKLDGLELLQVVRQEDPSLPVVMISGHGTIEMAVSAIQHGAYDFVEKPFKADRLLLVLERAIEAARLRRENSELRFRVGEDDQLHGTSALINQVRQSIERVAPTGSRVFITGPAGAGKEVAARALHKRSRRAAGPFVIVNCATLLPERLEEELFGVESETPAPGGPAAPVSAGAAPRKIGMFEQAHGGTLFLDEVADMPLETQAKIVRVLQDQSFQRVGGSRRIHVDVRVVASTNREIKALIESARFREDLYYRLNVVPLTVPPLRERREDIPVLANHLLARAAEIGGLARRALGDDAMAALQAYEWPGNVRQLRNVIDWLMIMAPGDLREPIRADQLPPEIFGTAPAVLHWDFGGEIMSLPLREAREVFEREYLLAQVTRFGGNISRTASFVGMERSALHRKLKSLGVSGQGDRRADRSSKPGGSAPETPPDSASGVDAGSET
ncbi:MAG: sigma-54-dependent Fis family transcriptional regulator [Alphaproteobacteria bacterium]|nr:sigma-54-dependent Fis family transcriptional regulator [Alphaproteobacteria bacterium]